MIRIDASEYSEKHAISRLIGAPPGYVGHDSGGQLTEYVRRKPYCIVLIDEIEKASREFITLFLQVLDDGRLTDGQGRVVDFRNTVIVMTSNLGASYLHDMGEGAVKEHTRRQVMGAIETHFPPEFVNRIDKIIIFVSAISYFLALIQVIILPPSVRSPITTCSRFSISVSVRSNSASRIGR
jgi:ATP-dependent Clp protease ATP-binding subunit ClpB